YRGDALTADRVTVDQDKGTAVAEGHAELQQQGQDIRAERLEWNYTTRVGQATDAVAVYGGKIVRGQQVNFRPGRIDATHASLTTCDLPRPHWEATARSLTVVPNDHAVARGVGLRLLGLRLLTVPRVSYSLRPGAGGGRSIFPVVGYNR